MTANQLHENWQTCKLVYPDGGSYTWLVHAFDHCVLTEVDGEPLLQFYYGEEAAIQTYGVVEDGDTTQLILIFRHRGKERTELVGTIETEGWPPDDMQIARDMIAGSIRYPYETDGADGCYS